MKRSLQARWPARHYEAYRSGYSGLKGEDIPLCGRIVAITDVFDALTHRRPYKEAWPIDRAIDEIASLELQLSDADPKADPPKKSAPILETLRARRGRPGIRVLSVEPEMMAHLETVRVSCARG